MYYAFENLEMRKIRGISKRYADKEENSGLGDLETLY